MRVTAIIAPFLLLFVDSGLVQALMHGSIEHSAATGICQVLLLLHDLPGALRYQWLLLNLTCCSTVLKSLVHLLLPAAIVVREWHVQVGQVSLAIRIFLVGCCLDLLWLEGTITEGIILGLLWLRMHLFIRTKLLAVWLAFELVLGLCVERSVLVTERRNFTTCCLVHLAANTNVARASRNEQVVHLV